jgi:hypothetical protein
VPGSYQIAADKKGHPRIEMFFGPGIFISPDIHFTYQVKEE